MRRILAIGGAIALTAAVAVPAVASQPDIDGSHKAYVCHATSSVTNPYVLIEVDVAAAGGPDAVMAHLDHAMNDVRTKGIYSWSDFIPAFEYGGALYGPYGPALGAINQPPLTDPEISELCAPGVG